MRTVRVVLVAVAATLALALAACSQTEAPGVGEKASAAMAGPDGASMGTVSLEQGPNGVLVSAEVSGLTPGGHGFHVHSVGSCSPDFSAAGGHFNVSGEGHGFMHEDGSHGGDLPNIYAGADGAARADVFSDGITLAEDADHSVFDDDGSAIIIHAKPDTYGEDPAAGDRVACGVILPD